MGRILGIDYGTRRVGLALSDPLRMTAQPYETWPGPCDAAFIERLNGLVRGEHVERVVLGHPLTLKGGKSRLCAAVERFAESMASACPVPVELWDERLTSVQAQRTLHALGKRPSRNKAAVDLLAASLMLQSYLDSQTRE